MKLTQYHDEVTFSDIQSAHRIEMKFRGSFMLDFADGIRGLVDKNILSVSIRGQLNNELLFKYKGSIKILSVVAYDIDDNKENVEINTRSDEWQKITSTWGDSTMMYEDYNKSLKSFRSPTTTLSYKVNGQRVYRDIKNNKIVEEKLNTNQKQFYRENYDI